MYIIKHKIFLLFVAVFFCSCFKQNVTISAIVEKGEEGSSIIKWEIYPEPDNSIVEIYASDNDSVFPTLPIMTVDADMFIAIINNSDSLGFKFFKLKVGESTSNVIANRLYQFDEVQNFRDIGGYRTNTGKYVRWGKIFRSGEFSRLSEKDIIKLDQLHLKSVIDLRPQDVQESRKDQIETSNRYEIYIHGASNDSITQQVLNNRFFRGDAIIYMQDSYEEMFTKYIDEYTKFFDYLTDENNYPLVYHCSLGKDQSGIATYLLLKALDVPTETIENDYRLSNRGVKKSKIVKNVSELSESQQQTFTLLTRTDVSYLKYGLACIRKEYNSIDEFMEQKLQLTKEKREKLRKILLY